MLRFTSASALRDFLDSNTVPTRPNRLALLGDPALTGMSRPELAALIERLSLRQAAEAEQRKHRQRGGDRQAGTRGGIFQEKSPTPSASWRSSSACAKSAPGRS